MLLGMPDPQQLQSGRFLAVAQQDSIGTLP
jgi:hypothetical protein